MAIVRRKPKIKPDNVLKLLSDVVRAKRKRGLRVGGRAESLLRAYGRAKK